MKRIALIFLTALVVAGCGPGAAPAPTTDDALAGTCWRLVEWGAPDAPTAVLPATAVTLAFDEQTAAGSTGCNSYSGEYSADQQTITIGPIAVTEMACLAPGVMEQEAAFLAALAEANTFDAASDRLALHYPGGALHFIPDLPPSSAALEQTRWRLEAIEQHEGEAVSALAIPDGMAITLSFVDGQLSGDTGCNNFGAPYMVEEQSLTVGVLIKTEALCPDEAQILVEGRFFMGLENVEAFAIAGDSLTLRFPGGNLVFRAAVDGA